MIKYLPEKNEENLKMIALLLKLTHIHRKYTTCLKEE